MRNTPSNGTSRRRSAEWFERRDLDGFLHRSWLKSSGVTDEAFRGRPVIGICNCWSELVNCNVHLRGLAESVKRGVLQAGGFPLEFPVHLARRVAHEADDDALPEPDGDGRRGVHPRVPARRRRPPHRLRQDQSGEHHGRGERRHPGDRRHRRADAERPLARARARLVQRLLALPRGAPRGANHARRTAPRSRTRCRARTATA